MTCVVYCIRNGNNGKLYIGSCSRSLWSRIYLHTRQLLEGKHHSKILQRAWLKHGYEAFRYFVLEYVEARADLLRREQYWIDCFQSADKRFGYNICPVAGSNAGAPFYQSSSFRRKAKENAKRQGFGLTHPPRTHQHSVNQGLTQVKLDQAQVDEVRALHRSGLPQKEIAARFGVCQQTVSNIVRKRGVAYGGVSRADFPARPRVSKISDDMRHKVREMSEAGVKQADIAKATGVSQSSVSNILKQGG